MKLFRFTLFLTLSCLSSLSFAQVNDSLRNASSSKKEQRKSVPIYLINGLGINAVSYRDFATSPLVYVAPLGINIKAGIEKIKSKREQNVTLSYTFGIFTSKTKGERSNSTGHFLTLNSSDLFKLNVLPEKWNLSLGYLISNVNSFRINDNLGNNSFGYELFFNAMASGKITRDLSRLKTIDKKILFMKFKMKPKARNISFRFDPGIINSSVRNNFAYIGQSAILNDEKAFDNYTFRIFSGLRFRTSLEYTRYLKNGNGIRWSYTWDALKTGRDIDDFELGSHLFSFSLLFKAR